MDITKVQGEFVCWRRGGARLRVPLRPGLTSLKGYGGRRPSRQVEQLVSVGASVGMGGTYCIKVC